MNKQENIYFENGHLNDDAVALYADGLLEQGTPELQEAVLVHVADCVECKDKIIDVTTFLRNPETVPMTREAAPTGDDLKPERKKQWYASPMRIAATFFAVTVMAVTFYYVQQDGMLFTDLDGDQLVTAPQGPTDTTSLTAKQPVKKTPAPKTVKKTAPKVKTTQPANRATAFIANPTLESMIGDNYRSSIYQVFSPKNNVIVNGDIHFRWRNLNSELALTLKIFDNDNMLFKNIQYDVKGSGFVFKEKLPPGLYYWKLETAEDLLYVGKFIVK